jgi:SAM-dependent methyltransferase
MPSDKYRWLAQYYDFLFEYRRPFGTARKAVIGPLLPKVKSACDLACGTGNMAMTLARRGIKTFAVDLSPDMCRITREKVRLAGLPIQVIVADMRDFHLPEPVDLITCEFDALNHIPQRRDLHRVLKCVGSALRPGGHFAFDVNNRVAFERLADRSWFVDKDPVAMVMNNHLKPGANRAKIDVEWFIRTGKIWERHHEHVEEIFWTAAEIHAALSAAGFDQIKTWDAAPFFKDALTRPGNRTFWRARYRGAARTQRKPISS